MDLKELQEQMTVLAAIQQRSTEMLKHHTEELSAIWRETAAMREKNDQLQRQLDIDRATSAQRMAEWNERIEKLVSGFGAFLAQVQRPQ